MQWIEKCENCGKEIFKSGIKGKVEFTSCSCGNVYLKAKDECGFPEIRDDLKSITFPNEILKNYTNKNK